MTLYRYGWNMAGVTERDLERALVSSTNCLWESTYVTGLVDVDDDADAEDDVDAGADANDIAAAV
jgi:hypothetical protein